MTSGGAGPRLPWVGAGLHLVVLAGALYFAAAGISPAAPLPLAAFVVGIGALLALELVPVGGPLARLVARAVLIHAVAAVDASGLSRALFLLVPFGAYLTLGRRAGLVTATAYAVGLVGVLTATRPGWYADAEQLSDLLMFLVGLVIAVSMAGVAVRAEAGRARTERLLDELAESHRQLGEHAGRVAELAAAQERNRLARDIHDSLGHHLTAVAIQLEKAVAYRARDAAEADRAVADARGSVRAALAEVRGSVAVLRSPAEPPATSLAAALDALRAQLDTGSVRIDCAVHGDEGPHAPALTALYRAAQEGLTNAVRHAAASRIEVTARFTDEAAGLTVRDDGRGLAAAGEGFGLAGMRERLAAVGGELRLSATPGGGTTLTATVPRADAR
ncbi:sensor histidine kinase [Pseudonocardia lacus]|uniref:sensor histidine kinase n=1 Tax=Pseudonocardia lacus TaxID=2835865 RepID=UPI001BDC8D3E|nr:sensor histidine kinase [Pseudonocardia lacus]